MAQVNTRNRKRADNSSNWEYWFEIAPQGGKRKRISKSGFKTKSEALKAGTAALSMYDNTGHAFTASDISFSDFLDLYVEKYCIRELAEETCKGYKKKIRLYIKPFMGHYRLKDVTPLILNDLFQSLKDNGYSRNTLVGISAVLSGAFKYAVSPLQFIQSSPMMYVKLPKNYETKQTSVESVRTDGKNNGAVRGDNKHIYIPKEWIDKIFERFPEGHVDHLPLLLGYRLGLRLGEAYALTVEDFDFEKKTVRVERQIQYSEERRCWYFKNPKFDSKRTVSADDDLLRVIREKIESIENNRREYAELYTQNYINENNELSDSGIPINLINVRDDGTYVQPRSMQHCSRVIHYDIGFKEFDYHSLRHTHASDLAVAGANPKFVQARLGHKSIKVTMEIYQHLTEEMERQGADILNNMFKK